MSRTHHAPFPPPTKKLKQKPWVIRGKQVENSEEISSVALLSPACFLLFIPFLFEPKNICEHIRKNGKFIFVILHAVINLLPAKISIKGQDNSFTQVPVYNSSPLPLKRCPPTAKCHLKQLLIPWLREKCFLDLWEPAYILFTMVNVKMGKYSPLCTVAALGINILQCRILLLTIQNIFNSNYMHRREISFNSSPSKI